MNEEKLTRYWFLIYLLSAGVVLGTLLALGIHFGPGCKDWLLESFVPADWHPVIADFTDRLFAQEFRNFLVTSGIGIGLVVIGLTLFPLKEKLSSTYERERFPDLDRPREPSLLQQGVEELKFAGLYLVLQGLSLSLAIYGYQFASAGLSISSLVLAMTLDHCAPFFQRRGRSLHGIVWLLLRNAPLRSLALGALFIGPVILLEKFLPPDLPPLAAISLLVLTEVIGMAFATLTGCHLGASLVTLNPTLASSPPPKTWTITYRTALATLTIWLGIFFGWWAKGTLTHHRLIRCHYRPDWRNTTLQIRETTIHLTLPIEVSNRSHGKIDPTGLVVTLQGEGVLDGTVTLEGPAIGPGESGTFPLAFAIQLAPAALENLPKFLKSGYSASLKLDPPLSPPVQLKIFPR